MGQVVCAVSLSWDLSDITVRLEVRVWGRNASTIRWLLIDLRCVCQVLSW